MSFPVRPPTRWLVLVGVLLTAFVVTVVMLVLVAKNPSYDPVPVPSVSST